MFKRMGTKILVAATMVIGGFAAIQQPTVAHASKTFSSIPGGHFQSAKAQYAFHFQAIKAGNKTGLMLVFGDFKNASVRYAVPVKSAASKNHRTLNIYYRVESLKGKLGKTNYKMSIYKYSNTKYRVKLYNYKSGLFPSYKGTAYTFKLTKSSPAKTFANKYTKPKLTKSLTAALTQYVAQQYAAGKASQDPNDPQVKAAITKAANNTLNKDITALLNSYNLNS
ncbi:hypothetical protein [Secundilactobacillus folii]|uniref:Uncharacterized protein n=1 Tax=Secundilactobacillus folii TaxID=2678357 RepID=A0A7X2XXB8_9LACO|nr:hypothetical protein [Secundilactobacillus folii]MTV82056.1 hypothetical protein [Secundilactobacillus folii]